MPLPGKVRLLHVISGFIIILMAMLRIKVNTGSEFRAMNKQTGCIQKREKNYCSIPNLFLVMKV